MIPTANLVEIVWLTIYSIPIEMTYEQGSELIGHEFRTYLIEIGYGITTMPSTFGNSNSNTILKWVHQFMGNLVWTCDIKEAYLGKDESWSCILAAAVFKCGQQQIG